MYFFPIQCVVLEIFYRSNHKSFCYTQYIYIYIYRERERERKIDIDEDTYTDRFKKHYTSKFYVFLDISCKLIFNKI